MKHRFWRLFGLSLLLVIGVGMVSLELLHPNLEARFARLTRGVNTAHWFAQAPLTAETFQTRITASDLRLIHSLGFQHVRLPVDPDILFDREHPDQLNAENLGYLDAALDSILQHDLAVIVDLHPQSDFKKQLYQDQGFAEAVGTFWYTLAHHLRDRSPELVFLEVLNEPATKDPQDWYTIQANLLAQMRRGAPQHTLIASANMRVDDTWDDIAGLTAMVPLNDPNIVYNFHFYKPMSFTHQGADWGEDVWERFANVPYPSTPTAIARIVDTIDDDQARRWLERYGEEQWNAQKIAERLGEAGEWGRSHHVHITCNEFGVYRKVAPVEARSAWIRDVRTSLEAQNMGWTMWEYNAGFGLFEKTDETEVLIPDVIRALFAL